MHVCSHVKMSVQMKSRLQRLGNKKALMACLEPIHRWIRSGHVDTRLKAVRDLHVEPFPLNVPPDGETLSRADLETQARKQVVEFFVKFASGTVLEGELNNQNEPLVHRQKPYGKEACQSAQGFKNVSPASLAISMASAYPFLVTEMNLWNNVVEKNIAYPLTSLWPAKLVKRFVHFNTIFFDMWEDVLQSYESAGGRYFPEDEEEDEEDADKGAVSSDTDDCDNVF